MGQHSFPSLYEHPPPSQSGPQSQLKLHLVAHPAPPIVAETGGVYGKKIKTVKINIIFLIVQLIHEQVMHLVQVHTINSL